jgi:hypothetical protein
LAASYRAQGFVEVGRTWVEVTYDSPLFDGCEFDKRIDLGNGQQFICGETLHLDDEIGPEALILRHPTTGVVRLVVAERDFVGTLEGTPDPSAPATPPTSAAIAATQAQPATNPLAPPTPVPPAALPDPTPAPVPGPRPMPPGFTNQDITGQPGTTAPPATHVRLIAPVDGTWKARATLGGASVDAIAMLNADGTFNRFERWDFGLTVQIWGTYSVAAIAPTRFQLSQRPTGWDPKEWCVAGNTCKPLSFPAAATQFTFLDANRVRDDQTQVIYERQVQ